MKYFNEGHILSALSQKIVEKAIENKNKKIKKEKISDLSIRLEEDIKKYAEKVFNENLVLYIDEITSPENLFYLKGGKDWGFCKEFLEIEVVKKYKNKFFDIVSKNENIQELDEAVATYTKNDIVEFNKFYKKARMNRIRKNIFNIAKKDLMERPIFWIEYVMDNYLD